MNVILISGKAQHGKDSSANILKSLMEKDKKQVLIAHYGDMVKYVSKVFWGWNGEKDEVGRTILQQVGTNIVRKEKPNYWVDFVKDFVCFSKDRWDYVLIPDVRFPNEVNRWRNIDGIDYISIRVSRTNFNSPLTEEQQNHPSETALDNWRFDYNIIAENMNELECEVNKFYELLKDGDEYK